MQQSLTANPHELAEAFRQIGNGFSRLARALDEREDAPPSNRELEYVPLEEVEQPQGKPKARTPRAALKAVPKLQPEGISGPGITELRAPVIESEPAIATVQVMPQSAGEPLPLREEWVEQLEAEPEADDPLPEFAQRETDETPEEVEAEKQSLIAHLKAVSYACGATDTKWQEFEIAHDLYNKERGWLRNTIEVFEKKAAKIAEATAPVAITNPKDAPAQLSDGRQKKARQDESGAEVAVYVAPNDPSPGPYKLAYDRFHSIFEEWRAKGQDYGTVRDKVESSVHNKKFKNFGELDAADLARATHALNNWNPVADVAQHRDAEQKKGAKK